MAAEPSFFSWMQNIQQQLEQTLTHSLPQPALEPRDLHQAMHYTTLGGGKRMRALLVCAAGEVVGAQQDNLLRIGAAVEMIHAYSLVHDDLPCMDNDALRRGKPSCHIAYGEASALLAGDALQTLAFELLATPLAGVTAPTQLFMVATLAQAAGHAGMAGGQAIDLSSVGQPLTLPELEYMHLLKTGALIRAAVLLGSMAGERLSPQHQQHLDHFAKRIGLAFQIIDDVLDDEADTQTLGKTAGKDATHGKPTYASLLGLSEAKRLAQTLRDDALAALENLGPTSQRLKALADHIVSRSF